MTDFASPAPRAGQFTTVTVNNAAPAVTAELAPADAGGVTLLSGSFTDPGFVDTHTVTVDWGDATAVETTAPAAQGAGWGSFVASHIYPSPGSYTVTVTVTDDDGGTSTAAVSTITVVAPVALFANSNGQRSLWVSGGSQTIEGDTHTNGELRVEGAQKTFTGPTTHSAALTVNGSHTFTPPATQSPVEALPVVLPIGDYQPGGRAAVEAGAAYHDTASSCSKQGWRPTAPLAAGLYWVPCDVIVTGTGFAAGPITIATSGTIKVTGSDGNFYQPFIDGALFISSSSAAKAIDVSGSGSTFAGYVHAASGGVEIAGTNHTFYCGIIGDTIRLNGTGTRVVARDCTPPATAGAVAPMLVPRLGVDLGQTPAAAIPGDTLADTATITNADATVLAPGIAGLENLSATDSATVTAGELSFEYYSITASAWLPVPTTAPVTVVADPNPHPAVTYPAPGGADPFAGTVIGPGGFATWGTQLQGTVAPATIEVLLDPLRTAAVRTRVELMVDPTGVPVRQLYRFGADLAPELRGQGADLTDAHVTLLAPDGTARFYDQTTTPALATLAPGASATIDVSTDIGVPAPIGPTETTAAYLDRLQALDGTAHVGVVTATATGGVGLVLAPQASALSTRHLPIVRPALGGPASTPAGSDVTFTLTLANTGGATANQLTADATIDANPVPVTGVPATLTAAGLATGEVAYSVPATHPGGTLTAAALTQWSDANDNTYGPADARYASSVGAKPVLAATLTDALGSDRDGSGQPSPGDQVTYTARITNTTATLVTGATFTLTPDPATTLETGSVTTTAGTVTTGNTAGDPAVAVAIGTMAAGQIVTITFAVTVNAPFPDGLSQTTAQGTVTADGAPGSLTDDPGTFGPTDPTITPIIRTAPALDATLADALFIDTNSDGQPGPGDQIRYTTEITPAGNAPVGDVTFTLAPDPNSALAAGTVTTTTGTISSGNTPGDTTVSVNLGTMGPFDSATITFDVTIRADATASQFAAQGTVASPDLTAFVTDDPDTAALDDPTVTQLTATGGGGTAGPTIEACTPDDGATITTPTAITCDLTPKDDTTIDTWAVTARPADAEATTQPVVIATGTGTPPAPLGTFDPTLVDDGIWIVTITATGSDGGTTTIDTSIVVDGQLKLGRYHITYQDMSVPVGGIPIQVLRTYDTLNKNEVGDFGAGWTLDVSDFRVQVNRPLGQAGWERYVCGGGIIFVQYCFRTTRSHYVTVTWPDGHTETFDFTPQGLSSFFGGAGIAKYAGRPNTTSRLEPAPGQEALGWSGDGNLYDDPFNYTTTYNPTRFVLVAKDGTRYTLDRNIGLVQAEDRNGNTVTIDDTGIHSSLGPDIDFTRDTQDRITAVTGPDDRSVTYTYTHAGDLDTVTDPNNHTTSFDYVDHALTEIVDPLGNPFQTLEYDPDGRLTAIIDANGNRTELSVDVNDRTQLVTSPDGRQVTLSSFDERGNETERTDTFDGAPHTATWTYSNDGRDLITSRTDPIGNVWSARYDTSGNATTFVDAKGHSTSFEYDGYGAPARITDQDGGVVRFDYDDRGNLATLTDPASRQRNWTYNSTGQAITYSDGLGLRRSWAYGSAGQLVSMTDALGTTTYGYDSAGRLVSETRPEGPVTYSYDPAGQLTAMVDSSGTTNYSYDAADRITSVVSSAGTVSYTYQPDGRRSSMVSPDSTTTYGYDAVGQLTTLSDSLVGSVSFTYAYGGIQTINRPTGVTTTNTYDTAGRLTRVDHTGPSGIVAYSAYELDPNGNRLRADSLEGTELYTLDALDRLTRAEYSNGDVEQFTYNEVGDRLSHFRNADLTTFSYDAAGRLSSSTSASGTTGYSYDGNGNVTASSAGDRYTWDSRNMMTSATVGAATQTYEYDAMGVRVRVDGAAQLWDRLAPNRNLLSDGTTRFVSVDRISLAEVIPGGQELWDLTDGLGSVRQRTDRSGTTVSLNDYWVSGEPRLPTPIGSAGPGFAGQHLDGTGLIHMRARQYDPRLGRFLSSDSAQPNSFGTGGYNLYSYAANNPATGVDPSGLIEFIFESSQDSRSSVTAQQLADDVGEWSARGYTRLASGKGWETRIPFSRSRDVVIRMMERGGQRSSPYYRISVDGKGAVDAFGNFSTNPALTHFPIEGQSLSHIIYVVTLLLG